MALLEIISFYKQYHAKRLQENLSRKQLFVQELKLLGLATVTVVLLMGGLLGLAWYILK